MGSKTSKPLVDGARLALSRHQPLSPPAHVSVPAMNPSTVKVSEQPLSAPPTLDSSSTPNPEESEISQEDIDYAQKPFDPNAPLPPYLLKQISKLYVHKEMVKLGEKGTIAPLRPVTVAAIRHKKDQRLKELDIKKLPLDNHLTQHDLHKFYIDLRDDPDIPIVDLAAKYNLTVNTVQVLRDVARLPIVVKDEFTRDSNAI